MANHAPASFKLWLNHNNFFTYEEKKVILARFENWQVYGSPGELARWIAAYGRKCHPDKIEILHLNYRAKSVNGRKKYHDAYKKSKERKERKKHMDGSFYEVPPGMGYD